MQNLLIALVAGNSQQGFLDIPLLRTMPNKIPRQLSNARPMANDTCAFYFNHSLSNEATVRPENLTPRSTQPFPKKNSPNYKRAYTVKLTSQYGRKDLPFFLFSLHTAGPWIVNKIGYQ